MSACSVTSPVIHPVSISSFKTQTKFLLLFVTGELNCHMQNHPREAMMWGKRHNRFLPNNPHSIESVGIIKFKPRSPVDIIAFDLDKKVLINSNRATCVQTKQ